MLQASNVNKNSRFSYLLTLFTLGLTFIKFMKTRAYNESLKLVPRVVIQFR